eukprot:964637-Rhodomonas_salina.2
MSDTQWQIHEFGRFAAGRDQYGLHCHQNPYRDPFPNTAAAATSLASEVWDVVCDEPGTDVESVVLAAFGLPG